MAAGLKMKTARAGLGALQHKEIHERGDKQNLLYRMGSDCVLADGFTKTSPEARRGLEMLLANDGKWRLKCDVESVVSAKEGRFKARSTMPTKLQTMQQPHERHQAALTHVMRHGADPEEEKSNPERLGNEHARWQRIRNNFVQMRSWGANLTNCIQAGKDRVQTVSINVALIKKKLSFATLLDCMVGHTRAIREFTRNRQSFAVDGGDPMEWE